MHIFNMSVSKKDKTPGSKTLGKYVPVGSVAVTIPTLEDIKDIVNSATITGRDTGTEQSPGTGLPTYADDKANWIQEAIFSYVKGVARNRLIPESATVKDGLVIPATWAEFTAESAGNGGEALAILREAKAAFAAWLAKSGKSDAMQAALNTMFGNRAALAVQDQKRKDKFKEFLEGFASELTEEQLIRFERPLQNLMDACEPIADADDWAA